MVATTTRTRARRTPDELAALRAEAYQRSQRGPSQNDTLVIMQFAGRGIMDAEPRVNVLNYKGWQHVGRQVRKGEKGVIVPVWFDSKPDAKGNTRKVLGGAAVFHISQTDPITAK